MHYCFNVFCVFISYYYYLNLHTGTIFSDLSFSCSCVNEDVLPAGNIPEESKLMPKRSVPVYRTPQARAKSHAKPAVIHRSTFDTTQADEKEPLDAAAVSQVTKLYNWRKFTLPL